MGNRLNKNIFETPPHNFSGSYIFYIPNSIVECSSPNFVSICWLSVLDNNNSFWRKRESPVLFDLHFLVVFVCLFLFRERRRPEEEVQGANGLRSGGFSPLPPVAQSFLGQPGLQGALCVCNTIWDLSVDWTDLVRQHRVGKSGCF